jgi:hypothetical protein
MTEPDGNIYEGDFAHGDYNGKGVLRYADGAVYDGEFRAGKLFGRGKYTSADGDVSDGQYVNNKLNGEGRSVSAAGDVREGEWKGGLLNGRCHLRSTKGFVFEGQCLAGERHGYGRMEDPLTRTTYEGEFRSDHFDGKGRLQEGDYFYEGTFQQDMKDGTGKERYPDGTEYEGAFARNLRHGRRVLRAATPDGIHIVYDGMFAQGQFDGDGILTVGSTRIEGEFRADVLRRGTIAIEGGRRFEIDLEKGMFVEVLKDGSRRDVGREELPNLDI